MIAPGNKTLFLKAKIPRRLGSSTGSAMSMKREKLEERECLLSNSVGHNHGG